jgi:hypothetical protein
VQIGKQRSKSKGKTKTPYRYKTVSKADSSIKGRFVVSVREEWEDQSGFEVYEVIGPTETIEECLCGHMRNWYCSAEVEPAQGYKKGEYLFLPKTKGL